jgi:hypothetical protein
MEVARKKAASIFFIDFCTFKKSTDIYLVICC